MNVVRMNFSHGSYEYHGGVVDMTRQSVADHPLDGKPVAIALDTKGPEVRTGFLAGEDDVQLVKGNTITVTVNPEFKEKVTADLLYMDYPNLPKVMAEGGVMYIDDGLITLTVTAIKGDTLSCMVRTHAHTRARTHTPRNMHTHTPPRCHVPPNSIHISLGGRSTHTTTGVHIHTETSTSNIHALSRTHTPSPHLGSRSKTLACWGRRRG